MNKYILPVFLLFLITSLWNCKNTNRTFQKVKNLSEYSETEFIPTPENKIGADKNAVYCVTLLYAWNEVRNKIDKPLIMDKDLYGLTLLNNSKSYIGALQDGEYSASGDIEGDVVIANAEFEKFLPFELKLTEYDDFLTFDNTKVAAFGTCGYDYNLSKIIKIVYYKNDDNFIIKLLPKDKENEIILYKSDKKFNTMDEMYADILVKTELEKKEMENKKSEWKYYMKEGDCLIIPKFKFNIETNYSTMEGKQFSTVSGTYKIEKAWQRTAFLLDESGAVVESEAEEIAVAEIEEDYNKPKPKKMIFDKPFLLILKRVDGKDPYFGLWTVNAELMVKRALE